MPTMNRRQFLKLSASLGAALALGCTPVRPSSSGWRERRELYPQGVASGDPDDNSVLLWTRRPYGDRRTSATLRVEVAQDPDFTRVIATTAARVSADSDWTCRVLVGHLPSAREYWYRFVDEEGNGSRIGRTMTAPGPDDTRPARFAFVSCQDVCEGALNAYRRMIFEDERAAPEDRLGFVLHLGDFIYEVVQYPDQVRNGHRYDRRIKFPVHFPTGKTVAHNRFWVPASLEDYRALYHAYLQDPDLQDARARWPFVAVWDNHEFSWQGWQSIQEFGEGPVPAQTLKVAANQAWFEYQPARVAAPGARLDTFVAPHVADTPVTAFDDDGLGREANNLAAINSLIVYRALRWGRHIDLILTDQHSFRSRDPGSREELNPLFEGDALGWVPEELAMQLDAGRDYADGHPPATLSFRGKRVANVRAGEAAQTFLGAQQKAWFLDRLRGAQATWKIWGNSLGTPDWRVDPQHLPAALGKWSGDGFAVMATGDWGAAYHERAEIFDAVRDAGITGFAIVSGDRHSFWAGYAAKALPPAAFEPVGVTFVGGSLISPGMLEASEHNLKKSDPLRPLYVANPGDGPTQPTVNLLLHHGVRSALEFAKSGDLKKAHAASNPELAPHLSFVDMGGHGYATVRVDASTMATDFVCIPRPIERSPSPDGGPLRYRVRHEVPLWQAGERPRMRQIVVEGDAGLAV
ncbi:alkaline phosphatase D family protein [Frateuria terrea]|uniref:Alkaline phosphatase D n=1 Tax=Frateuria terrea TaxID=529704 RepID=A0A1H6R2L1_9GAMM|nr:alkaline phosphatase D family protein [Frateuria terrea]SEI45432.1 alkaline phosphatase D [Frateuria terrea]SFP11191.1 alkaline phosphatase D [Frateuria terrea]